MQQNKAKKNVVDLCVFWFNFWMFSSNTLKRGVRGLKKRVNANEGTFYVGVFMEVGLLALSLQIPRQGSS